MKKIYSSGSILFYLLIILVLSTCTGKYEKKIQGKWTRIDIMDVNSKKIESWIFQEDGGALIIHIDSAIGGRLPIDDTCRYYINARLRKTLLHIEDCKDVPFYNGDWQIISLNSDGMMIVRNNEMTPQDVQQAGGIDLTTTGEGLLFREFTKK